MAVGGQVLNVLHQVYKTLKQFFIVYFAFPLLVELNCHMKDSGCVFMQCEIALNLFLKSHQRDVRTLAQHSIKLNLSVDG